MSQNNAPIDEIASQAHNTQRIKNDPRYQKIQEELATKKNENIQKAKDAIKPPDFQDKVEIKSLFNWQVNKEGEYEIKADTRISSSGINSKDLKFSGEKILSILGYKINLSEKVNSMKEDYMRLFIETKSHNLLFSKFSQVKFGMLATLLSVFGVTTKELQDLQKKALTTAIDENKELFAQNEYNSEMMTIFGSGKKDKRKLKVFDELRNQLITQMKRYGEKEYYSQDKILSIKGDQVQKIKQDLVAEKQNLEYLSDFQ